MTDRPFFVNNFASHRMPERRLWGANVESLKLLTLFFGVRI